MNILEPAQKINLIECPRDAMQGWKKIISTESKIGYLNSLLKIGFDTLDFGSFVSPKAIPQMADTHKVIQGLRPVNSSTKLLAIVANLRGATEAIVYDEINCIGFPFSISSTFQMRNTNSSIQSSFETVEEMQNLCVKNNKQLVVYISMGFGNPYGDTYHPDIVVDWATKLVEIGVPILSLADTVGLATPELIKEVTTAVISQLKGVEVGIHLHSSPAQWQEKLDAAIASGCKRFDGALKGIGGCPMANDDLVGNMDSALMIPYFKEKQMLENIDEQALQHSLVLANMIFN
ncbi:MAG: hydroxymethylglutaryl-CoA lyase [Chitinophagaceae bacterium]